MKQSCHNRRSPSCSFFLFFLYKFFSLSFFFYARSSPAVPCLPLPLPLTSLLKSARFWSVFSLPSYSYPPLVFRSYCCCLTHSHIANYIIPLVHTYKFMEQLTLLTLLTCSLQIHAPGVTSTNRTPSVVRIKSPLFPLNRRTSSGSLHYNNNQRNTYSASSVSIRQAEGIEKLDPVGVYVAISSSNSSFREYGHSDYDDSALREISRDSPTRLRRASPSSILHEWRLFQKDEQKTTDPERVPWFGTQT